MQSVTSTKCSDKNLDLVPRMKTSRMQRTYFTVHHVYVTYEVSSSSQGFYKLLFWDSIAQTSYNKVIDSVLRMCHLLTCSAASFKITGSANQ